jgi:hypothetical protein
MAKKNAPMAAVMLTTSTKQKGIHLQNVIQI